MEYSKKIKWFGEWTLLLVKRAIIVATSKKKFTKILILKMLLELNFLGLLSKNRFKELVGDATI